MTQEISKFSQILILYILKTGQPKSFAETQTFLSEACVRTSRTDLYNVHALSEVCGITETVLLGENVQDGCGLGG